MSRSFDEDSMPLADHDARVRMLTKDFTAASERFIARFEGTHASAATRMPLGGGWSAAQIAFHVAKVNDFMAGVISGDIRVSAPTPSGFVEREWAEIAKSIPAKATAPPPVQPPTRVDRDEALSRLRTSVDNVCSALQRLTEARGSGQCFTYPDVGTVSLYQIGEWATAHTIRHNAQMKRVLGFAGS